MAIERKVIIHECNHLENEKKCPDFEQAIDIKLVCCKYYGIYGYCDHPNPTELIKEE